MSEPGAASRPEPELSLVIPCFNEEAVVGRTVPELVRELDLAGIRWQIVLCDNGSQDHTGEILAELARGRETIVAIRVEVNEGYGLGVLTSLPVCRGEWVGVVPCDGQVRAADVVRLLEMARREGEGVLVKVRRRHRPESRRRRLLSALYNSLMAVFWPGIAAGDINGVPKLVRRRDLIAMELTSRDWMLDPELMIKARYLGLRVVELEVDTLPRIAGHSKVRWRDPFVFLSRLVELRFGGSIAAWRRARRGAAGARR